ncbi:MAG: class I SAM-dependent methyltransferase [Anaerolineales bacterium]
MSLLLRWFFYLLYNQLSWSYDLIADIVSLGSWRKWATIALPDLPASPVLELGHGPGHLQVELLSAGKRSFAIDSSWQMNRRAYLRLARKNLPNNIVNGYAQSLPFPKAAFEHVVATFPTEYIFQPQALSEVRRVLRSEGTLVIVPAAILTGKGLAVRALRLIYRITGQAPDSFDKQFTDQLVQPFHKAGFKTSVSVKDLDNSQVIVIIAHPLQSPS